MALRAGVRGHPQRQRAVQAAVVFLAGAAVTAIAATAHGDATGPGAWTALAPVPGDTRQEVSYVRVGSRLFLAGGGRRQEAFDTATESWSRVADLPAALDHIQGVAIGGRIFYVGGLDRSVGWPRGSVGTVHIYDPASNTFAAGAPMPAGRERGAGGVAVHEGRIFYAGGLHDGSAVPWFDVYDPVADRWSSLPDLPTPRDHFQAAVLDDRLYAIGGRAQAIDATTTANEAFDLTSGRWVAGLSGLPTPRGGFAAVVAGDEIVVMGGEGGGSVHAVVEAYRPATDAWRQLAGMPAPRHGIQAASCSGGLYVAAGGIQQGHLPSAIHDVLFPTGHATPCAPSPPTCDDVDATAADGRTTGRLRCSDPDGDALTFSIVEPPAHGTLSSAAGGSGRPNADGGFSYEPAPGFVGVDTFTFRASDGSASAPATARVTVTASDAAPSKQPQVAPPAAAPTGARLGRLAARLRPDALGRVGVPVHCPARSRLACRVSLALQSAAAFARRGGVRCRVPLGRGSASILPGRMATVQIRLTAAARSLVRRHAWVTARLTIRLGHGASARRTVVLQARRAPVQGPAKRAARRRAQ